MTTPAGAPASGLAPSIDGPVWHALSADRVLQAEKVDGQRGLSSAEVVSRARQFGPNAFDAGKVESRWRAFVRQYADPMQIVLLVAGIVSLFLKEFETGVVLILLTLFNAVLGLHQEGRAAAAVTALQKMMIVKAKVVRDGQLGEIPAAELVPGDLLPMVLASDAVISDGELIGDPTELVLVALEAKGEVDAAIHLPPESPPEGCRHGKAIRTGYGNRLERGGSRRRSRVTIGQLGVSYEREGSPLRASPRACRRPIWRGRPASAWSHGG